ncbi:phosphotriesterase family protein [Gordonia shandongensis]|uniref:phosphotriesterase family protein n=1 Tax=Gordonia shandongensis TaxID=376351 RepID=UPI00041395A8|nr:phosphotriesterase [Gordonia shandongensis]
MDGINTVTGPVPADSLGTVLTHEHIFVVNEDHRLNFDPGWNEDDQVAKAVALLDEAHRAGVDTLMDVSVAGLGRNVHRVARVAERVDLNIVVATGLYTYHDLPFPFHYTGPGLGFDVPDPLEQRFIADLTEGIGDTRVTAGFLYCAIEAEGLSEGVERVMRAVGRAAVATGAPVLVHTNPHTQSGLIAQRVLAEEGVDATRVMIGHCGDTADVDYLMRLADAGSVIGLDRFGLDVLLPYETRFATLLELLRRGYGDRISLSQDAFCYSEWFDADTMREVAPDWNYLQITGRVVPDLLHAGIEQGVIDQMLVEVPRRLLTRSCADGGARVYDLSHGDRR